jgi:prophage DNA circulation protein
MATGCYVTQYFQASFKGVDFEAMEVSSEHGRRGAEGEFVFSELTGYVDMGRKIRRYNLSARFPTNDHLQNSQALVRACESYGPGTLVHPTWGALNVGCTSIKITDNPLESGGYTTADMTFVEAESLGLGFSFGASLFGFEFSSVLSFVEGSFLQNYAPFAATLRGAVGVVATVTNVLSNLRNEYQKTIPAVGGVEQYQILSDFEDVIADAVTLRQPAQAWLAISSGFLAVENNTTGAAKYAAAKNIVNIAAKTSTLKGVARTSENAVFAATRLIGVTVMANAALETKPANLQAALLEYDQLVSVIDGEISIAINDCNSLLHKSLNDMLASLKPILLNRAYNLPALVSYDLKRGTHSLVAAWELFGDAKRFAEIESRNPYNAPYANQRELIAANE